MGLSLGLDGDGYAVCCGRVDGADGCGTVRYKRFIPVIRV